ncbi:MAG: hypothetical protein V3U08_05140, partial [Nitrospirales bacterium]
TAGSVTYVVNTHPLFYGTALADDGMPTRLWQDVHEDGLNGNEVYFRNVPRRTAPAGRVSDPI